MKTGIISWFRADKGYGFIKPDDKTKDIFFHYNELKKSILKLLRVKLKLVMKSGKIKVTAFTHIISN